MTVFWGIVGFAIGFNMAVAFAWWSLRRENRKRTKPTWAMLTDSEISDIVKVERTDRPTDPMLPYLMTMQEAGLFDQDDGTPQEGDNTVLGK